MTVVIPTYNRAHFVTKAIDSVLSQTFADYEIIVVDDGSSDATKEKLKWYEEKIRYIYQDNSGVSAARNTGIKSARGEWLAFLDSDDEWRVDYLGKQIKRVSDFPNITMQTANCHFIGLDGRTQSYFEINGSLAEFNGRDYLFLENPFCFIVKHGPWQVGSTIIRRKAISGAGLFDTSLTLSEDFDLMARVALQGSFGMIREELVNIYRRKESTECLTNQVKENPIHARESDEKIYEKLKKIEILTNKEHKVLNGLLSTNRRSIGNLLLEKGKNSSARNSYKLAFFIDPSILSLGKYVLSLLPQEVNLCISTWYLRIKSKK
ncbi:glycosyltransferase family 2 protein [Methylobacter psychrophilus]|uniref:glycosyltransferase family 2 protein n=1 Tax=Methylobacter psychrophilus TaxID=96941 RepID=UPI0021D4EBAB|nr:glycosyltransferase [Methylobacter psychrophilus]